MCLSCYPSACSAYRCLKAPPPVAFVCHRCGNPAYAGSYEDCFSEATPQGLVCGSCLYVELVVPVEEGVQG